MGDLNHEVTTTGTILYNGHNIYGPRTDTVNCVRKSEWSSNSPILSQCPFMIMWPMAWWLMVSRTRLSWTKQLKPLWNAHPSGMKSGSLAWFSYRTFWWSATAGLCGAGPCDQSKIILLDEPTSALDPISAGKIEETLYGLKTATPCSWWHVPCNKQVGFPIKQPFSWMGIWLSTMTPMKCSWTQLRKKRRLCLW